VQAEKGLSEEGDASESSELAVNIFCSARSNVVEESGATRMLSLPIFWMMGYIHLHEFVVGKLGLLGNSC
jgi:hypothetical protein